MYLKNILNKGFDLPSSTEQEKACIKAINTYLKNKGTNKTEFLIELRDFLLDYTKE